MKNSILYLCIISLIILYSCGQGKNDSISNDMDSAELVVDEEETNDKQADKNYLKVGPVDIFYFHDVSEWDSTSLDSYISVSDAGATLYVKSFDGDKFYYIGLEGEETKYLVKRTKDNPEYNAYVDHNGDNFFFDNPAWGNSSQPSSQHQYESQTRQEEPRRVIVEHHRDPQPVQEWVPCTGCNGSGKCFNCNGTGQNLYSTYNASCVGCGGSGRCGFCAGQGGHYETRYR
jgi:hypothetical protein